MIKNGEVQLIINTPAGKTPRVDEVRIRSAAVAQKIPIMTTLAGANAALQGIQAFRGKGAHRLLAAGISRCVARRD